MDGERRQPAERMDAMSKSTRRRRASWGSLQYDPKTRTARIRYWAEGPDGYRRRSKTIRNCTRKQAEAARAQLMLEHGEDAPCPTVAQVWERWVRPDYERRLEEGDLSSHSFRQFNSTWRVHVSPRWSDVPVDCVRPLDVQQWLLDGKTQSQAREASWLLKTILEWSMRYEFVQSNVLKMKYVMPSKATVSRRDKGTWSLAQMEEVWRCVHGSFIEPAFIMAAFGGCRVGESLGPMVGDVRPLDNHSVPMVAVDIVRQAKNRGGMTDTLKTDRSNRTTIIVGRAATRLVQLAESASGVWLTGDGVGGFVKQNQLSSEWERRVPDKIRHPFTNLRNSWQTNMRWEMGLPPWIIEPMMGHVGDGVTGKYYDRPQEQMFAEQLEKAYAKNQYDAKWTWLDVDS